MGQDKSSKRAWLRMFGKIVRQARRQTMEPGQRNTPMFTDQHTVYENKVFTPGLRSCPSTPKCIIGGEINAECICAMGNRHSKSDSQLLQRESIHPEKSTRNKFHTGRPGGGAPRAAQQQVTDIAPGNGAGGSGDEGQEGAMAHRHQYVRDAAAALDFDGVHDDEEEEPPPVLDPRMDF
eukprot:1831099-Prymnesium_polylepis.1